MPRREGPWGGRIPRVADDLSLFTCALGVLHDRLPARRGFGSRTALHSREGLALMSQAAGVKSWQNSQSCQDLIPEGCKAAITSSIIDIMIKCKKQLEKHELLLRCWQLLVSSGSQKFGISPLVVYDTKNDPKIFSHSTFPFPDFLDPWVKKKST